MTDAADLRPGDLLRSHLLGRGWTQQDLASVTGLSRQTIHALINDKSNVTPEVAVILGAALDMDPLDLLRLDGLRRLAEIDAQPKEIVQRREVLEFAPVREMQQRGWIEPTDSIEELQAELKAFFRVTDLQEANDATASFRMNRNSETNSRAVRAWFWRARQLAELVPAGKFRHEYMPQLYRDLKVVAAFAKETHRVPAILGKYGVRFAVVEHLKGTKLDGAAFWLDEESPAVALSIRYDRIDAFWFTLMHELKHIEHMDGQAIDEDLTGATLNGDDSPIVHIEDRANRGAAAALIDSDELDSFINRVSPLYSAERIIQFAHRIKVHPGIIVGQLQNRKELGFEAMRKFLVKVRDIATETSLTDGWGKSVPAMTSRR